MTGAEGLVETGKVGDINPAAGEIKREDCAFTRAKRITSKKDFDKVFRRGARNIYSYVEIISLPNHGNMSRLGMAISGKTGNAVQRNRIKRNIREAFRTCKPLSTKNIDMVVKARKDTVKASFCDIRDDFRKFIESI